MNTALVYHVVSAQIVPDSHDYSQSYRTCLVQTQKQILRAIFCLCFLILESTNMQKISITPYGT